MAQNEEVVSSGQALKQVQAATWLGITDPGKLLDDDPAAAAFQPRPEGLGLGAKFLAHHKAVHLTMPLEKRFGKRLQRASAQGESDAETPPQKKGRPIGQHQVQEKTQEHGDSSEEDELSSKASWMASGIFSGQERALLLSSVQSPLGFSPWDCKHRKALRLMQATVNGSWTSCEASSSRSPEV
ncbi:hypothetical protein WJX79_004722 [Trebouxia sp. C0005]